MSASDRPRVGAARGRLFLSALKRCAGSRRGRRAMLLALGLALLAHPVASAASDVFSNVGPASQLANGALAQRFPLGNYALDHHFDAASFSITGGIDISGVPALIAYFLADVIWQLTAFLANALITLFTFAFSLDLVNGSQATGGAGALAPVSEAVRSIYATTFGAPWLVVAIVLAGLWAMWKALVQRRYTETAGALGLSLGFCLIALAFVTQPQQTIGRASRWSNDMSAAFLSLSSNGSVGDEQQAKQQASDQLFSLLVYQPWTVLDFGGLDHCVKTPVNGSSPQSVPVRPLSQNPSRDAALSAQLQTGTEVQADGKVCINNENKYAPHFLAYAPESDERNSEYDALSNGDSSKLPASDPGRGSYQLSAADKPAADAMGKGGQYQRLLMVVVIFAGELGAFLLLGVLSVAVIIAQVLVLLLLAFAPVALVVGVYPGRGHDFFRGWLSRIATFLLRKAIYSLILAVLLAVASAVGDATSNLGWLLSFGLQAAFFWAVFLYRHQLTGQLAAATTGNTVHPEEGTLRLATIYAAGRLARRAAGGRGAGRGGGGHSGGQGGRSHGPGAGAPVGAGEDLATGAGATRSEQPPPGDGAEPAGMSASRPSPPLPAEDRGADARPPSPSAAERPAAPGPAPASTPAAGDRSAARPRGRPSVDEPRAGLPADGPRLTGELATPQSPSPPRAGEADRVDQGLATSQRPPGLTPSGIGDGPAAERDRPAALAEQLRQDTQRLKRGATSILRPERPARASSPPPGQPQPDPPADREAGPQWPDRPSRPERPEGER